MEFVLDHCMRHGSGVKKRQRSICRDSQTHPLAKQRKTIDFLQRSCFSQLCDDEDDQESFEKSKFRMNRSCAHAYPMRDVAFLPKRHENRVFCLDMKGSVCQFDPDGPSGTSFDQLIANNASASRMFVNEQSECGVGIKYEFHVYDLSQLKLKCNYRGHSSLVTDVKCEGELYITSSMDGYCYIWHPSMQRPVISLSLTGCVYSCAMVPGSPYQIITASQNNNDSCVKLFDVRYHSDFRAIQSTSIFGVNCPIVDSQSSDYYDDSSSDEEYGGSWSQGWSSQKTKIDLPKAERATIVPNEYVKSHTSSMIKDHDATKRIFHVCSTPKEVLTSCDDSTHKFWDIDSQQPITSLHGCKSAEYQTAPIFIRNYEQVLCGDKTGFIYLWDTYRTSLQYSSNSVHKFRMHQKPITAVAATELGDVIASSDNSGHVSLVTLANSGDAS